jgi:hypothetical protein
VRALRGSGERFDDGGCTRLAEHGPNVPHLILGDDRDDGASRPGTGGATGPVYVRLVLGRRVRMHHQFDAVHVNATRRHIGGNQDLSPTAGEGVQVADPCVLRQIPMQIDCPDAVFTELFG